MEEKTKEVLALMWWELVQNVPLIFGFVLAFSLWEENLLVALACMVVSSLIAAVAIAATEGKIFPGHHETWRAFIANWTTFSVLMALFAAYLSANWSSVWTDLVGGLLAGMALALMQDRAAREDFGWVRSLALGLSCAGSAIVIRLIGGVWAAIIVVTWFTLVMGAYKQWWQKPRRSEHA